MTLQKQNVREFFKMFQVLSSTLKMLHLFRSKKPFTLDMEIKSHYIKKHVCKLKKITPFHLSNNPNDRDAATAVLTKLYETLTMKIIPTLYITILINYISIYIKF